MTSGFCRRFGPDVTERFLQETGYALVVRSHQVGSHKRRGERLGLEVLKIWVGVGDCCVAIRFVC